MIRLTLSTGKFIAVRAENIRSVAEQHSPATSNFLATESVVYLADDRQLPVVQDFLMVVTQVEAEERAK